MYDIYIYTRNTKNSSTYFSPSGAINVLCVGSGCGGSRVIPHWYTGFLEEELPSPPSSPSPPSAPSSSLSSSSSASSSSCERAHPMDHPNEDPSTTSVPPVSPTAPAVSAAPVPPTAPAVAAAPVSPTAPAPPTASVPLAPPIAPVAPAPVRLSCEWVTRLGVVVSRFYQPP